MCVEVYGFESVVVSAERRVCVYECVCGAGIAVVCAALLMVDGLEVEAVGAMLDDEFIEVDFGGSCPGECDAVGVDVCYFEDSKLYGQRGVAVGVNPLPEWIVSVDKGCLICVV